MQTRKPSRWLWLLAFLLPAMLYLVVLAASKTVPFGGGSLLLWDAWEQDSAFLPYWRGVLAGGHDLLYSLSRGLGGGMAGMIGFYLASPLNFLLLLFPDGAFPLAFSFLVVLRIGLCGLTLFVFLQKSRACGRAGLFFSTTYALMGIVAAYAYRVMWLDSFVLLPLVALGILRIIERKKPALYLVSLALALWSQYYMGYMVCGFSVVYLLYRLLQTGADRKYAKGELFKILWTFALASLLAAGLAAVLLVPVIQSLTQGYTLFDSSLLSLAPRFSAMNMLTKLYTGSMSITQARDGLPNIYIGIPMLLCIPLYFFNPGIPLRKRLTALLLVAFFWASFQISALYYAWHAFEQPTYYAARFSFLFSFVLLELCWQGYQKLDGLSGARRRWIAAGSAVAFLALTFVLFRKLSIDYLAYKTIAVDVAIFLAAAGLVFLGLSGKRRAWLLLLLCGLQAACLMLNAYYPIARLRDKDYTTAAEYGRVTAETQALVDRVQEADGGLYRMALNDPYTHNDPLLYGYKELTHSNSDLRESFMAFADRLGFREIQFRTKYGNGASPVVESLFGFRYVLKKQSITHGALPEGYTELWTQDGVTAYENTYALPLAYLALPETLELADANPFVNQNTMMRDLTGLAAPVFTPVTDVETTYDGTWETYVFPVEANRTLYLWSMGTEYRLNGGEILRKNHFNGTVALPQAAEDTAYTLSLTYPLGIRLAYFDLDAFQSAQAVLAVHAAEVTSDTDSHFVIYADVTDEFTQLLVTVPYDAGWRVRVDGQKAETAARYGALLAVNLTPGSHTVELGFVPQGLWTGVTISVVSFITAVLWVIWKKGRFY